MAVCLLGACWPAFADTFIVLNTNDVGAGSLRAAIISANDAPELDTITFNISTPPPHSIHLLRALPPVTDPVIIDGTTQPGFTGQPIIELKSRHRPPGPSLLILAGGSTVRGLVLNQFGGGGIVMAGNGGNLIEGNFLGTDLSGTSRMATSDSAGNIVISNSSFNVIGGTAPASRNLISGNAFAGVNITGDGSDFNEVLGNFIGTDISGENPLGNGRGILIQNFARNSTIGGSEGAGNVIAFNAVGVVLQSSADGGHAILGNSIFMNDGLGIDLNNDGVTANDTEDGDSGPNNLQNFPVLTLATNSDGATRVTGSLHSQAGFTYRLEFFSSSQCDPSGAGEGKSFLSAQTVTTDELANAPFTFSMPTELPVGSVITVTATDDGGNTSEFSPCTVVQPAVPPFITQHPQSQTVTPGSDVILFVIAGPSPLTYQWRRNGADLPNETNDTLVLPEFQPQDGGSYTVVVANNLGALLSLPGIIRSVQVAQPNAQDNFNQAERLPGSSGLGYFDNLCATREPDEPRHVGKSGQRSVWFTWVASENGIATFSTAGGTFDTLLAAYTGESVDALTEVAGDDDSGGFFTSTMSFNAVAGRVYHIAIDGSGTQSGFFVLSWQLTPGVRQPEILIHPISRAVGLDQPAELTVTAVDPNAPHPGLTLRYQWFFNGQPIPGADSATLMIPSVNADTVGTYFVRVFFLNGFFVDSREAILQANETDQGLQQVLAVNKFRDAVDAARSGSLFLAGNGLSSSKRSRAKLAVRGFSGTQIFSSVGSTTEAGEPIHCDVLGGASFWFTYQPPANGMVSIGTEGSGFDTILAVYTGPGDDLATLVRKSCDDNGAVLDPLRSRTTFAATAGTIYWIAVDGVRRGSPPRAATGRVRLTWNLIEAPLLTTPPAILAVTNGGSTTFTVVASGSALAYQWQFNGANLHNSTNAWLTISNPPPGNEGNYSVVVTDTATSVTSVVATATALVPPAITSQPASRIVTNGSTVTFTATATGVPAPGFQWSFNDSNILGANSDSLVLNNVQSTNSGSYVVTVSNSAGAATSAVAALTVLLPLELRWTTSALSGVYFTVAGSANVNFTIQASPDLVSWESLLTTNSSTGLFDFTDTNSLIRPRQYYRALYDLP